jgi:hypothetical protein
MRKDKTYSKNYSGSVYVSTGLVKVPLETELIRKDGLLIGELNLTVS